MPKTMEKPATKVAARLSSYKTILVHAEPGLASTQILDETSTLALPAGTEKA